LIRRLLIIISCFCTIGIASTRAQAPVADFSASVTSGCGPLAVQFHDNSANSPTFWQWDFGNGQTSTQQNPSTSYSNPGTYTVTLIVRNRSGADAIRKTDYITVYPYPLTGFTSNVTVACHPANVQFTDQTIPGQGNITSWQWDFGDGSGSNQQNPSHVYDQTGYYNVTLNATNSGGCSYSSVKTRYIRVVDGIQPNFTWNQVSAACSAPFSLNFINQTAGPGNLSYSWIFGNGANPAAAATANPTNISFPGTGTYNVTLNVASDLGCTGTLTQPVPLSSTTATIVGPDNTCVNTPVTFSLGTGPTLQSAQWDFGDGATSTDASPTHSYTANGTYTVTVTSQYTSCTTTATKTITVGIAGTPTFTSNASPFCSAPQTVTFIDKTNPKPNQWLWDFGDGQTSTDSMPTHAYTSTGLYDVKLTTTTGGCSGAGMIPQYIKIKPPVINSLGGTLGACINTTPDHTAVTPVADISAVDGIASWSWSAPGATPSSSTSPNPSFTYATTGPHDITLSITTTTGCQTSATFTSAVQIGTPTPASITTNPAPPGNNFCGNDPITFSDPATPPGEYRWHWDFGDGTIIDTSADPVTHSFHNLAGKHITLDLIHNGCPQSTFLDIHIAPPIVGFVYKADCAHNDPYTVIFTDSSKEYGQSPFSAVWNFGDGSPTQTVNSINQPVTHPYTPPVPQGLLTRTVNLTVTDGACTGTQTQKIVLGTVPIDFTPPPLFCSGVFYNIIAQSQHPELIKGYYWHWEYNMNQPYAFSPSDTGNLQSLIRGNHTLTLVVQLTSGCEDSISHSVQVSYPDALFTMPVGGCVNSAIPFTDQSKPDPGTGSLPVQWFWNFGDSTLPPNPIQKNPTHNFADTGLYTVSLQIKDANGCSRTYTSPTPIHITGPIARFGWSDTTFYCPKTPLKFSDSSIGYNLTDQWTYGDGSQDNTGIHTYPNNGSYSVTLTVTDAFSCTNSLTKTIQIQNPIAAFDISDTTAICTPLQTMFTAHAQYYDSLYWNFGDGTTSTLPTTSHFYNTLDTFYAKLFVRGPGGCFDSATRRVLVLDPNKTTQFKFGPNSACDSVPVQFDITPPGFTKFTLVFGDNTADSSQNTTPFHMYRSPSTYTPTLVLVDVSGCIVNIGTTTNIKVLGSVPFVSLNPHEFCDSGFVVFTDYTISNDGVTSETLDFGDGSPPLTNNSGAANLDTEHYYNKPGAFLATLHVTTLSTCAETYTDTVHVHPTPHPVITPTSPLCTGIVSFAGSTSNTMTEPVLWAWDFGNGQKSTDQNPSNSYKPGSYTVQLQTSVPFGCKDTTSAAIVINPLPEIKGPHEITTPVGFPITIPFTYSSNVTTWVWTPADSLSCADCANPSATLVFKKLFRVTVTDVNNCVASDSILVRTICNDKNYFFPNTFSPNGDGNNDYFFPRGSNLYNIQSLSVFNRWGQLVFQRRDFPANNPTLGWDGTINGRPAPVDAYVYIAEVICNNAEVISLHGDVSLIR